MFVLKVCAYWLESSETLKFLLRFREFKETNNKTDIGIKAAAGLKPKKIAIQEVGPDPSGEHLFHLQYVFEKN